MTFPFNPAEQQTAAEQALTELGYAPPTARPSDIASVAPQLIIAVGSRAGDLLSAQEIAQVTLDSMTMVETLEKRKTALRLAGEAPEVVDVLATADTLPGELVKRMHDATRTLRARLEGELAEATDFAAGGSPTDSLAGMAERRVAALKEQLATLNELDRLSELTPSSVAERLQAVERLATV